MKTSNVILALLGLFLLVFIVAMIVIFCVKGPVTDALNKLEKHLNQAAHREELS